MEKIYSPDKRLQAILWMVCNCFMAASVLATIKYSSPAFTFSSLIASYYCVAAIITIISSIYSCNSLKTKYIFWHFLRSVMNVIAYFLYFHALTMTSIANVIALGYTDGILTCLFSYIILKESVTKTQIINLALSFIGAGMIISPNSDILNWGGVLAAMSAILWALSNIITKKLSVTDTTTTQLFYLNFFTFFIALAVAVYDGSIYELDIAKNYIVLLMLGLMVFIQFLALFKSLGMAKTGVVMPFFVVSVVFVHIYGYFFFGESQSFIELIGTLLVVLISAYQIIGLNNKPYSN